MTIITGDRYLDLLSAFIEEKTSLLLDEALLLKLNPVGLHYVQTRLEALEELEALRVGAPVDYLRAYVADLGDHRALEQLRRVLRLLGAVKVVAMVPAPSRDPTPITLLPFSRLRFLELRGCDLSTSAARGLLELRPILEKLICINSADALRHIFSERTKEIRGAPVWSRLADISCFGNGMLLMDESLQLLPAVEALDLSRNQFTKLAHLQKCSKLKYLDAGFNNITTVANLNKILHCVTKLVLRNNAVVSTRGLHKIASLEALDLSHNLISNFREVELLGDLPSLRFLWLEGNPISFGRWYRRETLSYFPEPTKLVLDGKETTIWEKLVSRRIVALRLRQRSKYGAFIAAQTCESSDWSPQLSDSEQVDDTPDKAESSNGAGPTLASSALPARKRNSRLASIIDVTGLKVITRNLESPRESSFNLTAGLDLASPTQSTVESKEQVEETVQDLIQRAEVLKAAGSTCWLKDLNALLESEGKNKSHVLEMNDTSPQSLGQKRRRRRSSRKGSLEEPTSSERSTESGEHEETQKNVARFSRESSAKRSSKDALASLPSGLEDEYLKTFSTFTSMDDLDESFVDGDEELPSSSHVPNDSGDDGGLKLVDTSGKFRLTKELVAGNRSSSPPQFNQALLRRRQTLEKELLLLPPERDDISPIDESDTSSGTVYSHLSDCSDSPRHSPSSVWQPYRFDHDQKNELSSAQCEECDSEGTSQSWSDDEAQEKEAIERGRDFKDSTDVVHTEEGTESRGKDTAPTVHTEEVKEPAAGDLIPAAHLAEGREAAVDDFLPSVHSALRKESSGRSTTAAIRLVEDGREGMKSDRLYTVQIFPEESTGDKEAAEAISGRFSSSGSISLREGHVGIGKENRGGNEELNRRSTNMLHPRSKSSRRIVQLESLPGVPESSGWIKSPTRESHELASEVHRAASLGVTRVAGNVLERSLSSSMQYANPFNITRSFSADANLDKREWSRSKSPEDALASTSLQHGESHEAADSGLQFHRVHRVVGPVMGQCA